MSGFTQRMIRAARLDVDLYEEVEADEGALKQAMGVVILSGIAAGIGSIAMHGTGGILSGTLAALVGWYVWAYIVYIVGTRILPEPQTRSNPGELLRTIGFSSSPGLIRIVGIIPVISTVVVLIAEVWMLVAMIIAIRQALDYRSTMRAVGVCFIGWIIQGIVVGLVLFMFGGRT